MHTALIKLAENCYVKAAFNLQEKKAVKDVKKFNLIFLLSDLGMLHTFRTNDFIKSPKDKIYCISWEQILKFDFITEDPISVF